MSARVRKYAGIAAIGATWIIGLAACGGAEWKPAPPGSPIPPPGEGPSAEDELAAMAGLSDTSDQASAPPPSTSASPVSADLPQLETSLDMRSVCSKPACGTPGVFKGFADVKKNAAMWTQEMQNGASSVAIPRDKDIDIYGVVIHGNLKLTESEGPGGTALTAGPWTAFRAPGAGIKLTALKIDGQGEPAARIVMVAVTSGEPLGKTLAALGKGKWDKRPSPIATKDLNAVKALSWGGGSMHARIAFEGDDQRASLGILISSKDAAMPAHNHPASTELLGVLSGAGTGMIAAKAGSKEMASQPLSAGEILMHPKGHEHAYQPEGSEPMVGVQIYAPPGPEQRFKQMAADGK